VILGTIQEVNSISLAESGSCSYSISANHFKLNVIDCTSWHNIKQNESRIIEYIALIWVEIRIEAIDRLVDGNLLTYSR